MIKKESLLLHDTDHDVIICP